MTRLRSAVCLLAVALHALPVLATAAPDAALVTSLQATMQQHIDRHRVSGLYQSVDLKTGTLRKLAPGTPHPKIFTMGDTYVLCADMRDEAGKNINVDFFVARRESGFVVFQSEVDNREAFRALIKQGKAVPLQ